MQKGQECDFRCTILFRYFKIISLDFNSKINNEKKKI